MLAQTLSPESPLLIATLAIAGMLALATLRIIGSELEYARRVRTLHEQVRVLRQQQFERLKNVVPRR